MTAQPYTHDLLTMNDQGRTVTRPTNSGIELTPVEAAETLTESGIAAAYRHAEIDTRITRAGEGPHRRFSEPLVDLLIDGKAARITGRELVALTRRLSKITSEKINGYAPRNVAVPDTFDHSLGYASARFADLDASLEEISAHRQWWMAYERNRAAEKASRTAAWDRYQDTIRHLSTLAASERCEHRKFRKRGWCRACRAAGRKLVRDTRSEYDTPLHDPRQWGTPGSASRVSTRSAPG